MDSTVTAREAAFLSLKKIAAERRYSNIETDAAIKRYGLAGSEKTLYTRLVYGTVERLVTIDRVIGGFSKIPAERIEPSVLTALRLGVYQIVWLDRVPDSAACNESVELVKRHSHRGAEGFVNGILRNVARNKNSLPLPARGEKGYLEAKYSLPDHIVSLLVSQYGEERATGFFEAFCTLPRVTVRVNTLVSSVGELESELDCERAVPPRALVLNAAPDMSDGRFFVQDLSSQECVEAVGARPGETVIDVCACPGGKSFGIAMDMNNVGRIISLDLHVSKLGLIEKGAARLGIGIIETAQADGRTGRDEYNGKADRVLCDVPCSGLGVIAKKPEIRFKSAEDISRLPETQFAILKRSADYVRPGGRLVYSTCTLNKNENRAVVDRFLSENAGFTLTRDRTLFPSADTDGFYYAVMEKRS